MVIKTQAIRLVDVFVLGPFMIWAGMQLREPWARVAMIAAGGATIAYNWQNYQRGGHTPHLHTAECPTGYVTDAQDCRLRNSP